MKIRDILKEDSTELGTNLVPVLVYLQKRSENKNISPKLKTQSLIQMVRNAGDLGFNYDLLVQMHENDPAVQELISDFNEDEVTVSSSADEPEESGSNKTKKRDSEEVVDQMAKSTLKK